MLNFSGKKQERCCDGLVRREFLSLGSLGLAGLTLPDYLRLQAAGAVNSTSSHKAVISIYLQGGPPHLDMYDLKPEAPKEIRGEFKPIKTNVVGMDICELFPEQARLGDKLAIVRNFKGGGGHNSDYIMTGGAPKERPGFGCTVSNMTGGIRNGMPQYVSVANGGGGRPLYLGKAHEPFSFYGPVMKNLKLQISQDHLAERKALLASFDTLRRDVDSTGDVAGMDAFTSRALDMISSTKVRDAFDLSKEPESVKARYGKTTYFLQALRAAEAGAAMITVKGPGGWDTHQNNFTTLRKQLPSLDSALAGLIHDLYDRGLDKDVAVVLWGEFGRTPKINKNAGRDHWGTGFVVLVGGGLRTGQVVGATDRTGSRPTSLPYTSSNVLATLYRVLGIDPAATVLDHTGRPRYLLDDHQPIQELV